MKKGEMGSETACVWTNASIMIVCSSNSRSEAVSLPTVDTVTCHGFGHEDHQVEDFDVQGSGNEPHRAVCALHLGEGVMKSSAGRSHGEKRNIVLPLSARRKTRCYKYGQHPNACQLINIRRPFPWPVQEDGLAVRQGLLLASVRRVQFAAAPSPKPPGLHPCQPASAPCRQPEAAGPNLLLARPPAV